MGILDILNGILSNFLYDILKKKRTIIKEVSIAHQPITQLSSVNINNPDTKTYSGFTEAALQRLTHILSLINDTRHESEKLLISEIAEQLNLNDVTYVESVFAGNDTPCIDFLDAFAGKYNINPVWLKHGKQEPFKHMCHFFHDATDTVDFIQKYSPTTLYFVKGISDISPCCIILQKDTYDYKILHCESNWRISAKTGSTGQRQTTSVYKLICELKGNYDFGADTFNINDLWQGTKPIVNSLEISEELFYELILGRIFPESLMNRNNFSYWSDNFTDINYKYNPKELYLQWYGQEFLEAQEIVKYRIAN